MKFSVLMPTLNRPSYVLKAVDAVLSQQGVALELIIKDGGMPIQSILPKDPRLIYIHSQDDGITQAVNMAMRQATGDIFCWANDDDLLMEGMLKTVEDSMGDRKWLYGKVIYGDREHGQAWDYEKLKQGNYIPAPAAFWTREAFEAVGYFDETVDLASDYEYWLRLGAEFEPTFIDKCLAYFTIHPEQASKRGRREQIRQTDVVRVRYREVEERI